MRSRSVILATASVLLLLALVAGVLTFYRMRRLRERQDDARLCLHAAQSVNRRFDDGPWSLPGEGDLRLLETDLEKLDAIDLGEPLKGSLQRLRKALHGGREDELENAARDLRRAALAEIDRLLKRSGERTTKVGQRLLQISLVGGPLLAALAAAVLFATIHLPLRRAGSAPSVVAAADAVSGVSTELAELLRDLDSERRARVMDLVRTGHLAALGTFAAGIAHEVRNPLMAVSGVAESTRRRVEAGDSTVDLPAELRRIEAEAHRAGDLLGQVLRLAPGEAQGVQRFDLAREARDVAAMVGARFGVDSECIAIDAPGHLVVEGQSARYRQILFNLLANALDSVIAAGTPCGRTAVKLRLEEKEGSVGITIEDRGIGFDPQAARRLFEPFYSSKRDGSGLGLFICEGLAREAGGRIEAFSAGPGEGATFRVTLPRSTGDREHEPRTDHRG